MTHQRWVVNMNGNEYLARYETEDSKVKEISRLLVDGVYQISGYDDKVSAWDVSIDNIMSIASNTDIGKSATKNEALIKLGSALIDGLWIDMPFIVEGKFNTEDPNRFYCFKFSLEKCMNEYREMILDNMNKNRKALSKKIRQLKNAKIKPRKDLEWMLVLEN